MALLSSVVALVNPANLAVGIPVTGRVWVLFTSEIDESSIEEAFFLEGPEQVITLNVPTKLASGQDPLTSPGYKGIVQGALTFERVNLADLNPSTALDTTGAGNLYRTRAFFTPTSRLAPNTLYRAYLSGDEDITDTRRVGARTRTVFDTVATGANTGTGVVEFRGGFTGTAVSDTFNVSISQAGEPGEAEFRWYRSSSPTILRGPIPVSGIQAIELEENVKVRFLRGRYAIGDVFSAAVRRSTTYEGNVVWEFTTGSESVTALPTTTSTSIIGDVAAVTPPGASLRVTSVVPERRAHSQPLTTSQFIIVFNKALDPATVTAARVTLIPEPVTGITDSPVPSGQTYDSAMTATTALSGATLTITLSGTLYTNNIITLVLDRNIAATDGALLGEDYQTFFTTRYTPLYASIRQVKLRIGSFLEKVPDDTVYLSLLEASRAADLITRLTVNTANQYYNLARSQWTVCKATEILLLNLIGAGGSLRSKRLADLDVSYDSNPRTNVALQAAGDCMAKWEPIVMGGGNAVTDPQSFVRGWNDPDRPAFGRQWLNNDPEGRGVPAANIRKTIVGARQVYRNFTRDPRGGRS